MQHNESRHKKEPLNKVANHGFVAPEFVYHNKNHLWYLGVAALMLAFLVVAIQAKDYMVAAVILAAGVAIYRVSGIKPSNKKVEVSSKGIYWGDKFISYHQVKYFWASDVRGESHIYLDQVNLRPTINFIVPSAKIERVLNTLVKHIPYHHQRNEPLSDRLGRLLRL